MSHKNKVQSTLEQHREQIETYYKPHNIIREKTELYYDFISTLFYLINETYLGPETVKTENDMLNHFTWCFNRVTENFEKEKIYFTQKNTHREYLWYFFLKIYYTCDKDDKYEILSEYFKILFDFREVKSATELESFIELYKILDQNLKKIN